MRGVSSIIFAFLLLAALAAQAQFSSATVNGSVTITAYTGSGGAVTIPTNINGLPVTAIAGEAFYERYSLTSIAIPNTVTTIGDYAFYNCANLTAVTLPAALAGIGNYSFEGCSRLTNITLPATVASIGTEAFGYCSNLGSVTLPASLTNIGFGEFSDCASLTNVAIPGGVGSIGNYAFSGCGRLNSITIPGSVTNIGYGAFMSCASLATVTVPNSVTNIGDYAFYLCPGLTNVFFNGNAPCADTTVFAGDRTTAYYMPGAAGWNAPFAGIQTVLQTLPYPVIVTSDGCFGAQSNQFGFNICWATNASVTVQACPDLAIGAWRRIQTLPLTNGFCFFSDPNWAIYPNRYFRVIVAQ